MSSVREIGEWSVALDASATPRPIPCPLARARVLHVFELTISFRAPCVYACTLSACRSASVICCCCSPSRPQGQELRCVYCCCLYCKASITTCIFSINQIWTGAAGALATRSYNRAGRMRLRARSIFSNFNSTVISNRLASQLFGQTSIMFQSQRSKLIKSQ